MDSKPVAAGPALPGRRASLSYRELSLCGVLVRRLRRTLLCSLSLYLSFVMFSTAGEQQAPQPMNLFVDIASNRLADEVDISKKRRLDLAGVPVVLGGKRQDGAAPSIAAGVAGSHDFDLGKSFSLKTSGLVSRIHTDNGTGILSGGKAGGDFALKYQQGGSRLLLKPSVYATMQRDVLDHMDYALESKLWQAIGSHFDLTATVGQSWRVSELLYTDNRQAGNGRLGVNIDLFDGSNLELAYGFNTTDGPLASHFRFSQGPTMIAHLKLAPGWRSEEHTSELQSLAYLVCRLLLEKKKKIHQENNQYDKKNTNEHYDLGSVKRRIDIFYHLDATIIKILIQMQEQVQLMHLIPQENL